MADTSHTLQGIVDYPFHIEAPRPPGQFRRRKAARISVRIWSQHEPHGARWQTLSVIAQWLYLALSVPPKVDTSLAEMCDLAHGLEVPTLAAALDELAAVGAVDITPGIVTLRWVDIIVPRGMVSQRQRAYIGRDVRRTVYERDGHRCVTCGATDGLTLDHIHPWIYGGPDTVENLQTMCLSCNSRKGASCSG